MPKTKDLLKCSTEQTQDFLDSFDVVLSDCDGVLWYIDTPIDGAVESLKKLQSLGKKLYLVTNNSTISIDAYRNKISQFGFDVNPEQIINTSKVITWYLNKINFRGEAFAIVSPAFREVLTNGGIKLAETNFSLDESDAAATVKALEDRPSVQAVIADFNMFCDWGKLAFAITCLKRQDVLYLCGALDDWVVCGTERKAILGPGPLINVITKQSGRTPIECGKPSEILKSYIMDCCKVNDPQRCLFIGDTIHHDMKFGSLCGFLKLLVGTGYDSLEDAQKNEETVPEFYVSSLGELNPVLDSLIKNSQNS